MKTPTPKTDFLLKMRNIGSGDQILRAGLGLTCLFIVIAAHGSL